MTYNALIEKFNFEMPEYAAYYYDDFVKEYDRKKPLLSEEDAAMVCDITGLPEDAKDALVNCARVINENDDAHLCGSFLADLTVYKRKPWVNYIYHPDLFTVEGLYPEQVGWVIVAVMLANTLNNKKPPEDLNLENLNAFKAYSNSCFNSKGYWGIVEWHWNMLCASGSMFLFGILKFVPSEFTSSFPIITNGKEYVSLAGGEFFVGKEGELVDCEEKSVGKTSFFEDDSSYVGHVVAQNGSVALTATAIYYHELCVMQKIGSHLGYDEDVEHYKRIAEQVKKAFNDRFYVGGGNVYERGSQTGLAMAIYLGLVSDETKQEAIDALVADIEQRNYALTSGEVGFCHVVKTLNREGRSDVIFNMNRSADIPGYAYQLKKGATSLTESWQAYDDVSHNHFMLGHIMEWLYSGLGGIRQAEESVAWEKIIIDPQMVGTIKWARTSLKTSVGVVKCYWETNDDHTEWKLETEIPAGSDAEVHLPDGRVLAVSSGKHVFVN